MLATIGLQYTWYFPTNLCKINIYLQAPTIAAAAYLRIAGRPPVLPSSNLSYAENFLYMLDSLYVLQPYFVLSDIVDHILIIFVE